LQNFGSDSEEHIEKQLQYQRDRWHFAISQIAKETLKSTENLEEGKKVTKIIKSKRYALNFNKN